MEREEIPRYVTDASVAVKWFIEEEETRQAVTLKERFENGDVILEAPTLLAYEVASALRFHPKIRITPKQFRVVVESLNQMQIMRDPDDIEWTTAFRLSMENPISIYDAIYLGLASVGNIKMVTADSTLVARLRSPELKGSVIMLEDLTP